ncbi:MAG: helix-hairpin-helix domain-containing protein [Alistipes sp.]|jgi:DNA uptake protein ComE-like DNA-binding protein|nr:helix-hairpin-helix domain-containing protein [Alistipes sp.]
MKDDRRFSAREARAVLWLLPVLAVAGWLVWEVARADSWAKAREDAGELVVPSVKIGGNELQGNSSESLPPAPSDESQGPQPDEASAQLFAFDPNTVSYHDLVRLGFERNEALGIVKYRERGKVFEIAEDFAACYQVSEAMYRRLEPYIRIGEKFRLRRWDEARERDEGGSIDFPSAKADGNESEGFSSDRGLKPSEIESRAEHVRPDLVDLNTADSAALIGVSGIGPGTVGRILEYRARLGGFAAVEQLAEVRGVTEQNYLRIVEQIYVDTAAIQKIDINFAPAKSLASHPYFGTMALRKLLKERQLKGGWRSISELETDDIFTTEELERLGPYLIFN